MTELRILHAMDSYLPNVGGLELSIATLAAYQAARGHYVAVATAQHPAAPARETLDGVDVRRLPMTMARLPNAYASPTHRFFPPIADPEFVRAFGAVVDDVEPDVIHARGWVLYSVLGIARRAGIPVVASAHDHSQVCAVKVMLYRGHTVCTGPGLFKCMGCAAEHYGPKGIPLAMGLHQVGSRRHPEVSRWTATSTALASRGSAPRAADRTDMTVIPTFIEDDLLARASDQRTAVRPDFVPQADPYLFYAGALGTHKGVDVLLDAHSRLRAEGIRIPLVMAGLPRDDYQVGAPEDVLVATNVGRSDVIAAWRHALVGVVPSVVPEGFGRVAVECLAAATPCVVSAQGGLLDIVDHGVQGLHVTPGDAGDLASALRRLLTDDALRRRLGAAGPAKAASFMLSRVAPQLEDLYRDVMNDRRSGPNGQRQLRRFA